MKAIELTEEHKSKLLEMCTLLFPEYFHWKISKKQFIKSYIRGNDIQIYKGEIPDLNIHWFEFCMTYLSERLYNEHYSLEVCEDIRNEQLYDCFINNHPIDYLYDEFKTLKLKN